MARVTRSRTIAIVEDNTALAIQTPSASIPIQHTQALAEIDTIMGRNSLHNEDGIIASELKSLKAAYRTAIGVAKRGRKSRSKKNNTSEVQEGSINVSGSSEAPRGKVDEMMAASVAEAPSQLDQIEKENTKVVVTELAREPLYTGRTTRHQAAVAQAGQYNSPHSQNIQKPSTQVQEARDVNVQHFLGNLSRLTSLQSESIICSVPGWSLTNAKSHLAEEALLKLNNGREFRLVPSTASEVSDNRVPIVEPDEAITYTEARTPAKSPVKTFEEVEKECEAIEASPKLLDPSEDSFVEQIISRSPAKPVSRIEDSVEALDELEEALEALDEATLAEKMAEKMISPKKHHSKARRGSSELIEKQRADAETKISTARTPGRGLSSKASSASMRTKSTPKHTSVIKKAASMNFGSEERGGPRYPVRTPIKRHTNLNPTKEPTKSRRPTTHSTFELPGDAVARRLKEQREARITQRESSEDSHHTSTSRPFMGPTVKSTKPLTKPSFELPGEALSRRKKEAHEARLRAQEEEERRRREFKATPLRKNVVPNFMPRETIASRARQHKPDIENIEEGKISIPKRGSSLNVGAHRPSLMQLNKANSSVPRVAVPPPIRKQSPTTHGPSMSGRAMLRTVSAADAQHQRQRAKEIYNRDAKMTEEMERERRERETAAKRAREEAAEKGRQASREWAERQLAKRMHEGDKGMSAGYGPGGQLGLRG